VDGGLVFRTRSGPNEVICLVAALGRQADESRAGFFADDDGVFVSDTQLSGMSPSSVRPGTYSMTMKSIPSADSISWIDHGAGAWYRDPADSCTTGRPRRL
jgi:hypothetical protein